MTIPLGTVVCSARLVRGAVTQRVAHVGRPSSHAKRLVRHAAGLSRDAMQRTRLDRRLGEPYKVIALSLYDSSLAELDALVERAKRAGVKQANRSAMIRVALKRLDLDAVLAEGDPVRSAA